MQTNIYFCFFFNFSTSLYALFNNSYYSTLGKECINAIKNCTQSERPILLEPIDQAPTPNPDVISGLLYYTPYSFDEYQVLVDEEFLNTFYLLYNNPNQLHVLFSLIKDSKSKSSWLGFLNSFEKCFSDNTIITCRNQVCKTYSYENLKYTPNIFVENIIGFEFYISENNLDVSFNSSILIYLQNEETRAKKIVKIMYEGINVFDALLNSMRYFSQKFQFSFDFPLLREMESYNDLLPFRSEPSNLLIRTH
ncbi:envelope glycoprotein L [macacine betaherpesvirus 9]|uniref:Envelope glycoprotein L n=1 Tax=macacine betaherpesvirus 9 TaxID=2560568 RepID=A0A191S3V8_9BETA|nr:envelope glycoprotein L [macacine betaherpesvirus 9]ANC96580.1 envelope glycoprotein L [macacine betaherpesvirus 9]